MATASVIYVIAMADTGLMEQEGEEEEEGPVCEEEPQQLTCGIQIHGLSKVRGLCMSFSALSLVNSLHRPSGHGLGVGTR